MFANYWHRGLLLRHNNRGGGKKVDLPHDCGVGGRVMILTKMLKQCKKNKHIQIIRYGDYDYLSDGSVAGCIDADVEDWTAEDCAAAIGIGDDERDKYIFPPRKLSRITEFENAVPMEFSIELPSGTVIQPFMLSDKRIFFVQSEMLNIFDNINDKQYFLSNSSVIHDTLFVMKGMFPIGLLKPMRVNLNKLSTYAAVLLTGLNASEEAAFFDAGGQMEITEPVEVTKKETK